MKKAATPFRLLVSSRFHADFIQRRIWWIPLCLSWQKTALFERTSYSSHERNNNVSMSDTIKIFQWINWAALNLGYIKQNGKMGSTDHKQRLVYNVVSWWFLVKMLVKAQPVSDFKHVPCAHKNFPWREMSVIKRVLTSFILCQLIRTGFLLI